MRNRRCIVASTFRDLRVWQQAMELAVATYRFTGKFPKHELYGLVSQLRRSAVSVASNIAEGKGRHTDREFTNFLYHARGSLLANTSFNSTGITILIEAGDRRIIGPGIEGRTQPKRSHQCFKRARCISNQRPRANDQRRFYV